jgi:hypothetical protein
MRAATKQYAKIRRIHSEIYHSVACQHCDHPRRSFVASNLPCSLSHQYSVPSSPLWCDSSSHETARRIKTNGESSARCNQRTARSMYMSHFPIRMQGTIFCRAPVMPQLSKTCLGVQLYRLSCEAGIGLEAWNCQIACPRACPACTRAEDCL